MIVEWGLTLATGFVTWLLSLFPDWDVWPWFADLGNTINSVTTALTGLGVWVNWAVIGACVTAVLTSWIVFAQVKLARFGASHLPGVGGSG
jgi:hypothetical protein